MIFASQQSSVGTSSINQGLAEFSKASTKRPVCIAQQKWRGPGAHSKPLVPPVGTRGTFETTCAHWNARVGIRNNRLTWASRAPLASQLQVQTTRVSQECDLNHLPPALHSRIRHDRRQTPRLPENQVLAGCCEANPNVGQLLALLPRDR
jgi:hypothetical protein